jgi:hypothetical protein
MMDSFHQQLVLFSGGLSFLATVDLIPFVVERMRYKITSKACSRM